VRTTGPGKWTPNDGDQPSGDCPDLIVEIKSATCTLEANIGTYEVRVTATITNIGSATANSIYVHFDTPSDVDTNIISSLAPGASHDTDFVLTFSANQPPDCPLDFTVEVDPHHTITECKEDNNIVEGSVACPRCQ
jgi:subtilase family serine protease